MENNELNLWLLKRSQAESVLKSEERKLSEVKKQYSKEKVKYASAKESFNSTKLKLLNSDSKDTNPRVRHQQAVLTVKKLKAENVEMSDLARRVSGLEEKLKRHSVLVLQNKFKLENLEGRIGSLIGKKIARKHLREELDIIDGKIQQIVQSARELQSSENTQLNPNLPDQPKEHAPPQEHQGAPLPKDNTEYYRKIEELEYLLSREGESVSLRYVSKSGAAFDLKIQRGAEEALLIEIFSHEKTEHSALKNSKEEIIRSLREQGFTIGSVIIAGLSLGKKENGTE